MKNDSLNPAQPAPESSVPGPGRCVTLGELVKREGGRWRADEPSAEIEYPLPEYATREVKDYLRPLARVTAPEQGMAFLPQGRVYGAGVVLSAGGEVLARDVAEDFGKSSEAHWLLGQAKFRAPTVLDGRTAVVAVNHGGGYCHWLLEELPRLLRLRAGEADNVILNADTPFARRALAWRSGAERTVAVRRTAHFACAPLLVPSLVAEAGCPTPAAVRTIREFTDPLRRGAEAFSMLPAERRCERLYISRAKAARRRVSNELAMWSALEARGFARVFLEDLAWEAQIALMRRARVVVAPHGAGLANLVFCAPGTRVVEGLSRDYASPLFWRLAALGGLDYRPVLAEANGRGELRLERGKNAADLTLDVAAVLAAVDDQ